MLLMLVISVTMLPLISGLNDGSSVITVDVTPLVDEPCSFPYLIPLVFHGQNINHDRYLYKSTLYTLNSRENISDSYPFHEQNTDNQKNAFYLDSGNSAALVLECVTHQVGNKYKWNGIINIDGVYYYVEPVVDALTGLQHKLTPLAPDQFLPRFETKDLKYTHFHRQKRMVQAVYYIDILVITDHQIYQRFYTQSTQSSIPAKTIDAKNKLRTYFALLVNIMNLVYKNMASDKLKIEVNLVGIFIPEPDLALPWTTILTPSGQLTTVVLDNFASWVKSNTQLQAHDHAMLFTGYDIVSKESDNIAGTAVLRSMCKSEVDSVSVVVDKGGFLSVRTACHELAHSLGADHDVDQPGCLESDQYLMTGKGTSSTKVNQWTFSPCSVTEIEQYVQPILSSGISVDISCLNMKLHSEDFPDVGNRLPGELYGPDKHCRQLYGQNSYLCRDVRFNSSDICSEMYCYRPQTGDCKSSSKQKAFMGTPCGNNKWCERGQCMYSESAPSKNESCLFGDQPSTDLKIINQGQTTTRTLNCSELLRLRPEVCYQPSLNSICCSSCMKLKRTAQGCEYGNKMTSCDPIRCNEVWPDGYVYDTTCCETCGLQSPFICKDEDESACQSDIRQSGRGKCYDFKFAFRCCKSCESARNITHKACEYGDKGTARFCDEYTIKGTMNCDIYKDECCQTCSFSQIINSAISMYISSFHVISSVYIFIYLIMNV